MNVTTVNFSLARSSNAHGHPNSNLPKQTYGGGEVKVERDSVLIQLWLKPLKASKTGPYIITFRAWQDPVQGRSPEFKLHQLQGRIASVHSVFLDRDRSDGCTCWMDCNGVHFYFPFQLKLKVVN